MKRIKIQARRNKKTTIERDGWRISDEIGIFRFSEGGWSVTHLPSGYRITSADTKSEAVAMARRLRDCGVDWKAIVPQEDPGPDVRDKIADAVRGGTMLTGNAAIEAAIVVKGAVQHHLFCRGCQGVMDQARTVVVTGPAGAMVRCGSCYDKWVRSKAIPVNDLPPSWEIHDGRSVPASAFRACE